MHEHTESDVALSEMLQQLVQESTGLVVLFTEGGCHVGEAVEPKLRDLVNARFSAMRELVVSRDHAPEFVAQLGVFVFPTVVVWFAGKETARFVRNFSLDSVAEAIERPYGLLFG